jgi:hypothetical protein
MKWFVPLHCAYAAALAIAARQGAADSLDGFVVWFAAIAVLRFVLSAVHLGRHPVRH